MKKFILLFAAIFISSCSIRGLTNDYGKLSEQQKKLIVPLESFDSANGEKIYKISGIQLKNELIKHPKALVYIFKNGCTSDFCRPMTVYENYAREHGYDLFLVMDGYANLNQTVGQPHSKPLYAIDSDQYNTSYRGVYSRRFENQLLGRPLDEKYPFEGNLYFFTKGNLDEIVDDLPKS